MDGVDALVTIGSDTMRAAVVETPGRTTLTRVEMPEPGPGQVRVRLEGCGVCASNLSLWEGQPWFDYPFSPGAPGHEGWGRVDAIGADVSSLEVGARVAALSGNAYAEFDLARADQTVLLPPELDGVPFPGEPLGCAFNIMARSRIEPGQTVAIVGIGFLGAILTRLISNAGARVIALSRRPFALEIAAHFGASETLPLGDHHAVIASVREMTNGVFCDRVIECTGKQWPLDLAGELTGERGMLVIAGYHQDGSRQVNLQLWNWRGLDVVNAHERDPRVYVRGMREAVSAVTSGALDPLPLYTHVFPLERLGDALDATRDRPEGFLKALVTP
jgi:threonine dehydrogenase-like Zn-dependent dehydrogenase